MEEQTKDIWSQWLLHDRFGGDPECLREVLEFLVPVRDKILDNARLDEGETLLDVGTGDGLVGFGALDRSPSVQVLFSDISPDLLGQVRRLTEEAGVTDRTTVLEAAAEDLSMVPTSSVDVVTTRSVLIYVADKGRALSEFHRVLRPGGRLSIFEPINRFGYPESEHRFCGYDVSPVAELALKVEAVFERYQPPDSDPMLDFDERDLLGLVEAAGFEEIHLDYQAQVKPLAKESGYAAGNWELFLNSAGNPKIPTMAAAINEALSGDERATFTGYLRPLVEEQRGIERRAVAYLWAVASGGR